MKKDIKKIELKSEHKRFKLILSTAIALFITLFLAATIYGVYSFFTTYGLQSPVVLRSPIYRLHPEVIVSPVSSKSATLGTFDLGKIADKIYILESSGGKNDGCRNLGLYNGYGFRQNSFEWVCYSSHEEVRNEVITWLTKHIKDGDINSALCLYNRGRIEDTCTYAVNFNSL